MKSIVQFIYSIAAYLIGFASLLFWIASISNLVPAISIDRNPEVTFFVACIKNVALVLLFAVPHSVLARKKVKDRMARLVSPTIERSTYVLQSGVLLSILVWQWEPLGGTIWSVLPGSPLFYTMYILFFIGWIILFISTFLINHFDLFGLRQTYLALVGKPYTPLIFKITGFYKYVRHPLYLGIMLGIWATPQMTLTHLLFAILLTAYIFVGTSLEEKDLVRDFGDSYSNYKKRTPMLLPLFKRGQH